VTAGGTGGHGAHGTHGAEDVDCNEALARLFEFIDAEIDDVEGDRIRRHLADCEPCLSEYDVADHLKKLVRRSCLESAPAELHVRIKQQLTVLRTQVQLPE
jgi:mycothiol system anti-sigma-R factor